MLERDGFCMLPSRIKETTIQKLLKVLSETISHDSSSVRARSSRGHVYAARNLIGSVHEVSTVWNEPDTVGFLTDVLGKQFGLVRALFFDKPPDRTWNLPWHKDTSIAVQDNGIESPLLTRPTVKAGVPHMIAADSILQRMITLRIHLDDVTDENGPLKVIPGSHVSSTSDGVGVDQSETIYAVAGEVLAMRPLITHSSGSSKEGTHRHRRILHLEFASAYCLPPPASWHDFVEG